MVQAIFLDTTALFTLGPSMTNSDFQGLAGLRSFDWPCKICTSMVNWLEYLRQRKEQVDEVHGRVLQTIKDVEKLQLGIEEGALAPLVNSLINHAERIQHFYDEKARAVELIITPTPKNISLDLLVSLALECEAPFERKKEKGFRDAVALFSFYEYAQERQFKEVVIVSNDGLFRDAARRFAPDYGLVVTVVNTIQEASDAVAFGASWITQRLQMEANMGAMYYLEARPEMLANLVAEINPYDRIKYAQQYLAFSEDHRRVLVVTTMRFVEIAAASHDYRGTDSEALFFRLKCEMDLLLQIPPDEANPSGTLAERVTAPIELYGQIKVKHVNHIIEEITPAYIDRAAPPSK